MNGSLGSTLHWGDGESESKLRCLVENLPDIVLIADRSGAIQFVNRDSPAADRATVESGRGIEFIVPEHREACRQAMERTLVTGLPQTLDVQDVFGQWWSSRVVPLAKEGHRDLVLVICTNVTQERLATEAVAKEQRLLRQLLDLHERERRLTAYEIHDGFAQQLTGALYRLQGFREGHGRDPAKAWQDFDAALRLICRAIDETRRLISGLRPPVLDESGVIEAVQYLICEHQTPSGPQIAFVHDVAFDRLPPPLEAAVFRIVQESLHNACRHSGSDKIRVQLIQRGERLHIDIRDWGVGFCSKQVAEQRFGLRGMRERVRLLDGRMVIESAPGKGTKIGVELPLVGGATWSGETDIDLSAME